MENGSVIEEEMLPTSVIMELNPQESQCTSVLLPDNRNLLFITVNIFQNMGENSQVIWNTFDLINNEQGTFEAVVDESITPESAYHVESLFATITKDQKYMIISYHNDANINILRCNLNSKRVKLLHRQFCEDGKYTTNYHPIRNSLIFFGGRYSNDIRIFSLDTKEMHVLSDTNIIPLACHSTVIYHDDMVTFGGFIEHNPDYLNWVYSYNFALNTWTELCPNNMEQSKTQPKVRYNHSSVLIGPRMYILGGWNDKDSQHLADMWSFHLEEKKWCEHKFDCNHSVVARQDAVLIHVKQRGLDNNVLLIIGGGNAVLQVVLPRYEKSPREAFAKMFQHEAIVGFRDVAIRTLKHGLH
jgi:hypothetical protein